MFSITAAMPMVVKPAKDSLLDLISPGETKDSNLKHFFLVFCNKIIIYIKI